MMNTIIGNDWDEILSGEFSKDYFVNLKDFVASEYLEGTVYPPKEDVFNALRYTSYSDTKVVILGQDPYHEEGQAHGLSFSVPQACKLPPSLVNIMKELSDDIGPPNSDYCEEGILVPWAKQGVLLLNAALTVRAHEAGSHHDKGWEVFTDSIIAKLASRGTPLVYILWGASAGKKKNLILDAERATGTRNLIITAPHPSPLSAYRGFFGGRYFSRANYFLEDNNIEPIDWSL